jgi:hypothetical protein
MIKWRGGQEKAGQGKGGEGMEGKKGEGRGGKGGMGWDGVNPPPRKQILATALLMRNSFIYAWNCAFSLTVVLLIAEPLHSVKHG